MKRLAYLLLVVVALGAGATLCRAQEAATLKPPAKRDFKYKGKIVTNYDTAKDQTTVLIQLMPIKEGEDPRFDRELNQRPGNLRGIPERLEFSMYFTYPGQTVSTPKEVSIGFLYVVLEPHKYESRQLSAKVDGVNIDLGKMRLFPRKSIHVVGGYKPYTSAVLETSIPYEQFLILANAKRIKMKLGEVDFDLNKDHLEAIRDLASRTAP